MATYTTNYNLKKPAGTDFVTPADFNGNMDILDENLKSVADNAGHAVAAIAPDYADVAFPVSKGQPCVHDGGYYIANQDIASSEVWTAAHWDGPTTTGEKIVSLQSDIGDIQEDISGVQENVESLQGDVGDIQEDIGDLQEEMDDKQRTITMTQITGDKYKMIV